MDSNGEIEKCPDPHPTKVLIKNPWFTSQPPHGSLPTRPQAHDIASDKCAEVGPLPSCSSNMMASTSSTFYQQMTDAHESNLKACNGQTLTCLLCTDPIHDKKEIVPIKKYKLVRNLCSQLRLSHTGFPKNPKFYPLCTGCEKMLKTIWDCQQIITHTITKIERKVADVEILVGGSAESSQGDDGNDGFIKLREMILEGYRAKLVIGKFAREKKRKFIRNPFYSKNLSTETTQVTIEEKSNSFEVEELEETEETSSQTTTDENVNTNTNQVDMAFNTQSGSGEEFATETETQVEGQSSVGDGDEVQVENTILKLEVVDLEDDVKQEEEVEPPVIGIYNEANCTLTVKYPQTSKRTAQQLKAEKRKRLEATSQRRLPNETDNEHIMAMPSAPGLGPTPPFTAFKGVRILIIGGDTPEQRYLQCGRCRFTVNSTNYRAEGTLPIQTMKHHIITVHLNMRATPVRSFKDAVFKEPLPVGPPRYRVTNPQLPCHSSSVKLPVGGGKCKALLSQNVFSSPKKKKKQGGSRKRDHVPRKYTMPVDKLTGEPITFPCHLCERTFSRNCHRSRHMSSHLSKELRAQAQQPPILIPQPTFNPILVAQPEEVAMRMPNLLGNESGMCGPDGGNASGSVDELLQEIGIRG